MRNQWCKKQMKDRNNKDNGWFFKKINIMYKSLIRAVTVDKTQITSVKLPLPLINYREGISMHTRESEV
jgi:hypothetical protein